MATYGGLVIIAGGLSAGEVTADVCCIDPERPYWSDLTPLPSARHGACAAVLDGCLFVCGGTNEDNDDDAGVGRFSYHTQIWTPVAPLPSGRSFARAVVQGGLLYVI